MTNAPTIWQPQPGPQTDFCKSGVFEVFYGGSAGGGKSDGLIGEALRQVHISEYRAIIFRRKTTNLSKLIDRSTEIITRIHGRAKWHDTKKTWKFPSGAVLKFSHMEHEKDKFDHDGIEYHYVGFDELTHFTETQYLYIISRMRKVHPDLECYIRSTGMPQGIGLAWVKARFVDLGPNNIYLDPIAKLERCFIPSKLEDNRILIESDPLYDNRLKLLGPKLYKALRNGDWTVIEGAAFEELDASIHMLPPHLPPQGVLVWRAMDWGYARPFSIGWYYEDNDGDIVRFKEWYGYGGKANVGLKMGARDVAKGIIEMDKNFNMSYGVVDPSIQIKTGSQDENAGMPSIEENMLDEGVYWQHAINDRIPGWLEMHARLAVNPDTGNPGLRVTEDCKHWWRTVPMLQTDDKNPEDVNKKMEDHPGDETRYSVMSRPARRGTGEVDFGTDRVTAYQEFF